MRIKLTASFYSKFLLTFLIITLFSSCFKSLPKLQVVYQNDFEDFNPKGLIYYGWANGNIGVISDIKIVDFNGTKVFGRFNNSRIELLLNKLPAHDALSVEFDLYLHDNWKNDIWKMTLDGSDVLLTGFSNDPATQQSYPNWYGNGSPLSPAGGNAFTTNLPGACRLINSAHGTSMYKMVKTYLHTDSTFQFNCSDAAHAFNDLCEISWSIDNLKITTIRY